MKKAIAAIVLLAACAGGGFAAGYMLRPSCGAAQPAKDDSELAAKLEKAQKRIASLEKQLEGTKKSALASKKASSKLKKLLENAPEGIASSNIVVKTITADNVEEEIKKHMDADAFAAATNAMEEMRAKLRKRSKNRIEFLSSVDTSRMSEKQRENHERFLSLLQRREALSEKMKGKGLLPDFGALQEMVALDMEMRPIAKDERAALLQGVANELGYTGEDAEVLQDTINTVFDCTGQNSFNDLMDGATEMIPGGAGTVQPGVSVDAQIINIGAP